MTIQIQSNPFVSITSTLASSVSTGQNPNAILYLTTDNSVSFITKQYTTLTDVQTDFGVNSDVSSYASLIFAQSPNFLSGAGTFTIAPLINAVSASAPNVVTSNISANLTSFQAVTQGYLTLDVNGNVNVIGPINFSSVVTLNDIATLINFYVGSYVTVTATTTTLTFTNNSIGSLATLSLEATASLPSGGVDITTTNYLNITTATSNLGTDDSGESIESAVTRLLSAVGTNPFVYIVTDLLMSQSTLSSLATYIQSFAETTNPLTFIYCFNSYYDTIPVTGTIAQITALNCPKNRPIVYLNLDQTPLRQSLSYAYISNQTQSQFGVAGSSTTPNAKTLSGIVGDSYITNEILQNCRTIGADCYLIYGGTSYLVETSTNTSFSDVYSINTLTIEENMVLTNVIATTPKLPSNSSGTALLYNNLVNQVFIPAVNTGFVTTGNWIETLPSWVPSNKQQQFLNAIENQGYYIYVTVSNGTATVYTAALLNGSINYVYVYNSLSNS